MSNLNTQPMNVKYSHILFNENEPELKQRVIEKLVMLVEKDLEASIQQEVNPLAPIKENIV